MKMDPNGRVETVNFAQLITVPFNEIDITNITIGADTLPSVVVYKNGGTTVGTLTITYDGSGNMLSVVRT